MQNNNLTLEDGELLKQLIKGHPSLTSIDFSNQDTHKQRNKLGNKGVQSIVEAITEDGDRDSSSLIGMISVAGNFVTDASPFATLLSCKASQIVTLNLSNNDIGDDFLSQCSPYLS